MPWLVGGLLAAAVAAAAVAGLMLAPSPASAPRADSELAGELVADHLRSVPEARPVEVASNEPNTIRAFFDGRVPFAPVAPELPGTRLIGGRLCIIRGHAMQVLFYEKGGETLSLFVSADGEDMATCDGSAGHAVCQRRSGDVTLRLVGQLPPSQVDDLLRRARL